MENKTDKIKEFNKVKEIITKYIDAADCGIYDTRNIVGDQMVNIFNGKYFKVDICFYYSYFEVFGMTDKQFSELEKFYEKLVE